MRVLVIEDERQLAGQITRAMVRHGHTVHFETDGDRGLAAALATHPDMVILDLNLPSLPGMEILAQLRRREWPGRVLILTAKTDVEHRVRGLKAGADDYLTKPFSMEELAARVEVLGRRGTLAVSADTLRVGDLTLDLQRRRVDRAGRSVALSPREFDLLSLFMREPGRVFSRTELCERVWQRSHEYDTRTVEIFITRLRKKITGPGETPLLHTIRASGYTVCVLEAGLLAPSRATASVAS